MLNTVAPLPDLFSLSRLLCIAVFVPELHGDFVGGEGEELFTAFGISILGRGRGLVMGFREVEGLPQAVVQLVLPFLG